MADNQISIRLRRAALYLKQKGTAALNIEVPDQNLDRTGRAHHMTLPPPSVDQVSPGIHKIFDVDLGDWVEDTAAGYSRPSIINENYESDE